jgi:hypothetical protein
VSGCRGYNRFKSRVGFDFLLALSSSFSLGEISDLITRDFTI